MVATAHATGRARELPPGMQLGRYTLLERLAHGGMAELYLASAEGVGGFRKLVALKLVLPHLGDDETLVGMLLDEARLAARLDHPNIAQVIDLGETEGEHYMAMEYVHGQDLRAVLADSGDAGGFPLECGLAVVIAACYGLDYAHELTDDRGDPLGIVHRDISPSNLIVRYDGCVKVIDFGIAKAANHLNATSTGMLKGKSGYMSPEQARGECLDRRSDIFGLGIVLFEATTSQRLFYGHNEFAILNRICDVDIDPPSRVKAGYPEELEQIVLKALAAASHDRFSTARRLRAALQDFALAHGLDVSPDRLGAYMRTRFGEPALPETTVAGVRMRRRASPRGWWVVPAVLGGIALGAVGFLAGRSTGLEPSDARSQPQPAVGVTTERAESDEPPAANFGEPIALTRPSVETVAARAEPDLAPTAEPDKPHPLTPPNEALERAANDLAAPAPEAVLPTPVAFRDGSQPSAAKRKRSRRKRRNRPHPKSALDSMMPRG